MPLGSIKLGTVWVIGAGGTMTGNYSQVSKSMVLRQVYWWQVVDQSFIRAKGCELVP